jgi:hypothetical protein
LIARSSSELRELLTDRGNLLPLPSEPASLANVMEIELKQHLVTVLAEIPSVAARVGTERSFPDLEFSGGPFGEGVHAVDIKCARRRVSLRASHQSDLLKNRIALYTGNTYFKWPDLKFSGILRPFGEYVEKVSVVVIYTFDSSRPERVTDVEVVAHPTWMIASRSRASTTREYIGSVQNVTALRAGQGEFESEQQFYDYWRHSTRRWKQSPEAEKLLRSALQRGPRPDTGPTLTNDEG